MEQDQVLAAGFGDRTPLRPVQSYSSGPSSARSQLSSARSQPLYARSGPSSARSGPLSARPGLQADLYLLVLY